MSCMEHMPGGGMVRGSMGKVIRFMSLTPMTTILHLSHSEYTYIMLRMTCWIDYVVY